MVKRLEVSPHCCLTNVTVTHLSGQHGPGYPLLKGIRHHKQFAAELIILISDIRENTRMEADSRPFLIDNRPVECMKM